MFLMCRQHYCVARHEAHFRSIFVTENALPLQHHGPFIMILIVPVTGRRTMSPGHDALDACPGNQGKIVMGFIGPPSMCSDIEKVHERQ